MVSRFILLLAVLPSFAHALNPLTPLADYNHASWTIRDGAPPEINSMAQTADGRLWMSGVNGLYRFDGVRFEKYRLPGNESNARRRVGFVRAHPNGDLYISHAFGGGLSVLHPDGRFEDVIPIGKLASLAQLLFDDNGDIWTVNVQGLHRVRKGQLQNIPVAQALAREITDARIDRYGRLWVASVNAAYLYDRASEKFTLVRDLPQPSALIESPDGRIWTANGKSIQALPAPSDPALRMGKPNMANLPGFGNDWVARFDRDGNLWQLKCPTDLCVTPAHVVAATDTIVTPEQVNKQQRPNTNTAGNVLMEDREHNIWVATLEGIDRYRDNRLHRQQIPMSTSPSQYIMVTDENGQVWASDLRSQTAWRLKRGAPPEREPMPVQLVSKDFGGALMLANGREIERRAQGKVEKIALPAIPGADGKPKELLVLGVTDDGKRLWLVTAQTGLIGRRGDGPWLPRDKFALPPNIVLGVPGTKAGQLWLACGDGNIVLLDENDKQTAYPAGVIGLASGIYITEDIVASGDQGLAVLVKDRFLQLTAADPEVLQDISGLAVTPDGDRWLNGGKGLVHVRRDDWKASVANPGLPLRYEVFGLRDGYVGKAMLINRHASVALDKDGQLWLASTSGMLRFDTRDIPRNTTAPVPQVEGLHTGAASYQVRTGLKLPPGSRNLNITYIAASLRQPEAVRFQYRLEGSDSEWQDAGPRRAAYYTNMAPGSYRFQVRAANEDGVWSQQPASAAFEIPPTFTETLWFKALCVLAAGAALYLLYLYRLRIVTARLEERMEVRLAERERIARTLHDTFLQTVQGVVLRLDATVDSLPGDSATRQALAPILHSARHSINEGRAQVHELRSAEVNEVESRLRDVAALLAASYPGVQFALHIDGACRTLRPGAIDEISEIGREAIRNAYQHAQATQIEVRLGYEAQQFALLVRDDGKGMAPASTATTPAQRGHWGLVGMRERAERIGAALEISSVQDQGSEVKMVLPARRAYADSHIPWWRRLFGK
ncbi:Histidine kinase-, DNA gyrase B-, and HSP90-like ATPase [Duganella sp. CF402]|uniref:sensor histidine kinase n=1 Tax=unclassified Duganella TaxID=2636909 RepID=UPI0008C0F1E0|nr:MULTISPECIES: sensor histidine kinase [unclassified Duganella]RZT10328.1 histidine kinase/DNA gyrase B/HSP90-like ATPase [Duganella sp. BK701]SEL18249.1 Histidine kinase-, DNA gyrase B-, and HSP90-like ATPase [Duganella sp. CF402]